MHPTILSGDVTPTSLNPSLSSLTIPSGSNEGKDTDLQTSTDINDDGNISDNSANDSHDIVADDGPVPVACDRGKKKNVLFILIDIAILFPISFLPQNVIIMKASY